MVCFRELKKRSCPRIVIVVFCFFFYADTRKPFYFIFFTFIAKTVNFVCIRCIEDDPIHVGLCSRAEDILCPAGKLGVFNAAIKKKKKKKKNMREK